MLGERLTSSYFGFKPEGGLTGPGPKCNFDVLVVVGNWTGPGPRWIVDEEVVVGSFTGPGPRCRVVVGVGRGPAPTTTAKIATAS